MAKGLEFRGFKQMKDKLMNIIGQKMVPLILIFLRTFFSFSENFFGILRFVNGENMIFNKDNLKKEEVITVYFLRRN